MKNSNDSLKEKAMNLSQLESISGGKLNQTEVKYKINMDECIGCYACASVCPVGAVTEDNDNDAYKIDDSCIGCGACAVACPVKAINTY
jgi:Fe-S-cluster-containing hydrogenase component 2